MEEQALLPSNRMQSNKAQQWLPAKGCALLHKDTLDSFSLPSALGSSRETHLAYR